MCERKTLKSSVFRFELFWLTNFTEQSPSCRKSPSYYRNFRTLWNTKFMTVHKHSLLLVPQFEHIIIKTTASFDRPTKQFALVIPIFPISRHSYTLQTELRKPIPVVVRSKVKVSEIRSFMLPVCRSTCPALLPVVSVAYCSALRSRLNILPIKCKRHHSKYFVPILSVSRTIFLIGKYISLFTYALQHDI